MYEKILTTNKLWQSCNLIAKELRLISGNKIVGISTHANKQALYNAGLRLVKVDSPGADISCDFVICENGDDYNLLRLIDGNANTGIIETVGTNYNLLKLEEI